MITKMVHNGSGHWYIEDGVLYNSCTQGSAKDAPFNRPYFASPTTAVSYKDPTGNKLVDVQVSENHLIALNDKGHIFGLGENKYGKMTGSKVETYTELREIKTPSPVKKVFVAPTNTHILTTDGQIYGTGVSGKGQLGIAQAHEKTKWTQPEGSEGIRFSDYNVAGYSHVAKSETGNFYRWGTFLENSLNSSEIKLKFHQIQVPNGPHAIVSSLIPLISTTSKAHNVASKATIFALRQDGTVSTMSDWRPFANTKDVVAVRDGGNSVIFEQKDGSGIYKYNKSGILAAPQYMNIADQLPDVGERDPKFTYIGKDSYAAFGVVSLFYYTHKGLPYAWNASSGSPVPDVTKNIAMFTGNTLDYPVSVISTMMMGCNK